MATTAEAQRLADALARARRPVRHVRIHRQCGACGFWFDFKDSIVASKQTPALTPIPLSSVGNSRLTRSSSSSKVVHDGSSAASCCTAFFSEWLSGLSRCDPSRPVDFCWFPDSRPDCTECVEGGETATLHLDCFNLYIENAKGPNRLHQMRAYSLARSPWPESPALLLPPKLEIDLASRLAADVCNIKRLADLPFELQELIWSFLGPPSLLRSSTAFKTANIPLAFAHLDEFQELAHVQEITRSFLGPHSLLRFSAVMAAVNSLSLADSDNPVTVPLGTVQFWQRGCRPQLSTPPPDSRIELTIDPNGIESIRRLAASEEGSLKRRTSCTVYSTALPEQNLAIKFHVSDSSSSSIVIPIQELTFCSSVSAVSNPSPKEKGFRSSTCRVSQT